MAMKFGDSPFIKYLGRYATRKRPEKFRDFRRVLGHTITPSLCDQCLVSLMMIMNKSVSCRTGPTLHTPHEQTGAFSGALV